MRNNFIITCPSGRAGTKFLAHLMDESEKWTVLHDEEPEMFYGEESISNIPLINKRLDKDFYGEICGGFMFNIDEYKVDKKGIIIRNPIDEFISVLNFNTSKPLTYWTDNMDNWKSIFEKYDSIIESGKYYIIFFKKMVSDVEYTKEVLEYFGITDVEVTINKIKTKVNYPGYKKYKSLDDLPIDVQNKVKDATEWFIEKYDL